MSIIANLQNGNRIAQQRTLLGGTISNGTGIATGAPATLALGANTITTTQAGTFIVTMPSGSSASAATAGGTVSPSPTTCPAGVSTVITVTVAGTITITVTVAATASAIEVVGLNTIQAVIAASIDGGYKLDPAAVTIAGNKVTVQPMYYHYGSGGVADGVAINVPTSVDLSAQIAQLTVIGY